MTEGSNVEPAATSPYQTLCDDLDVIADRFATIADINPQLSRTLSSEDVSPLLESLQDIFRLFLDAPEEEKLPLIHAGLNAVAVFPPSAVVKLEHLDDQNPIQGASERQGQQPLTSLLDAVMSLIEQVTEVVCSLLLVRPESAIDAVMPLYRLITGWECAFRGKADCLQIVDRLLKALLGHGHCCEAPTSSPAGDNAAARPLFGSDRLQETVDVYHCIVAAFGTTIGKQFDDWVMTTPYWVTLLNIAAGYTCAFTAEDVVSGQMPATHKAGLMMFECLAGSAFTDLAMTTAVTLVDAMQVWQAPVGEPRSQLSSSDVPVVEELFILDADSKQCQPRQDWFNVCPSRQCGGLFVVGWLASVDSSYAFNLEPFDWIMRFFTLASSRPWPDSGIQTTSAHLQSFWALPVGESTALRLVALRAAEHFVLKETYDGDTLPFGHQYALTMRDRILPAVTEERSDIVAAEIDVFLAFFESRTFDFRDYDFVADRSSQVTDLVVCFRILEDVVALLHPHRSTELQPETDTACWKLLSCMLKIIPLQVEVPNVGPQLAEVIGTAIAQLEQDSESSAAVPLSPSLSWMVCDNVRCEHSDKAGGSWGRPQRCVHRRENVAFTRAQVLTRCVARAYRHLWPRSMCDSDRQRFVACVGGIVRGAFHAASVATDDDVTASAAVHDVLLRSTDGVAGLRRRYAVARCLQDCKTMVLHCAESDDQPADTMLLPLLDLMIELTPSLRESPLRNAITHIVEHLCSVFSRDELRPDHIASTVALAIDGLALCGADNNISPCGAENAALLRALVVRVNGAGDLPQRETALKTLIEYVYAVLPESTQETSVFLTAIFLIQNAAPGTVSLATAERCWSHMCPTPSVPDPPVDEELTGHLLRVVPRQQLRAASERYEALLMRSGEPLHMCGFVQFADASLVREKGVEIVSTMAAYLRDCRQEQGHERARAMRLAQCVIDNAIEGRGITIDWAHIKAVLKAARVILNLPSHAHPADDPTRAKTPPTNAHMKGATLERERPHVTDREYGSDSDSTESVELSGSRPVIGIVTWGRDDSKLECRRAIAAVLAVAEWMHRNCVTTVIVTTVQQGPVLERTLTASSDALRQFDPDAAAAAPMAAAMVVSSVMHWLLEIERSFSPDTFIAQELFYETQQLWDRIARWALDPALNAALLTTLPVPRENILRAAMASDYLSPWAMAAVEEALFLAPHVSTSLATRTGKRCRRE